MTTPDPPDQPPDKPPDSTADALAPHAAAVLLIGTELLTGKIRDENGYFLTRFLRRRGIVLEEICVVPDDEERIGQALLRLCERAHLVFTTGGVGPTHDDRTLAAVARALHRPLRRHARMEAVLRDHFGERITPAALSMADLPEGTEPCALPGWPVLRLALDNALATRIYILPGVPALLRAKLEHLESMPDELPRGHGWRVEALDLRIEESSLASDLEALLERYPQIDIGSYPRWTPDAKGRLQGLVRVTLEAPAAEHPAVLAAHDELRQKLASRVVEPPEAPETEG